MQRIYLLLFVLISGNVFSQELSVQTGHSSSITDLKYSPDGKYLFSAGADNKVIIWDMTSQKQMKILSGHKKTINCIAVSPKGNFIATAGDDKTVKIWEYPSGKLVENFTFFTKEIKSVDYSNNSDLIACGSDSLILVYIHNRDKIVLPFASKSFFDAVAFNEEGKLIAFGGKKDRKIRVYDIDKKEVIRKVKIRANSLKFENNSKYIFAAGNKGNIKKAPIKKQSIIKQHNITANYKWNLYSDVDFNNKYYFGANRDNLIYMFKFNTGRRVEILKAHTKEVLALAVSPDGKYLASAGKDRKIIIWNIEKRNITKILQGGANSIKTVSFTKDGKFMFIGNQNGSCHIWNLSQKGKILYGEKPEISFLENYFRKEYTVEKTINNINTDKIFIQNDLKTVNKAGNDIIKSKQNIVIWDLIKNENILLKNPKSSEYSSIVFSDTTNLYLFKHNATHDQKFSLLNRKQILDRQKIISTVVYKCDFSGISSDTKLKKGKAKSEKLFKVKGDIYGKAVCPDGELIAILLTSKNGKKCELWNIESKQKKKELNIPKEYEKVSFSEGNKYLIFTKKDSIILFDRENLTKKIALAGKAPFRFSSNDKQIAYTDNKRNIKIYEFEYESDIFNIPSGHLTDISDIQFNEAYKYFVTAGYDGIIKFRNLDNGKTFMSLAAFNETDFMYVTPKNYYYSTKGAMDYIGFIVNDKLYTFEQFDLRYNRPDIVMSNLPYSSEPEIDAYRKAFVKRTQKMGYAGGAENDDSFDIPVIRNENIDELPFSTNEDKLNLKISAADADYNLKTLNVWINNVPLYGTKGEELKGEKKNFEKDLELNLTSGKNKVQVSYVNELGVESLKETFTVICDKKVEKRDLYLITIGVNEYMNSKHNLQFASKDAQDIVGLFKKKNNYFNEIKTLEILNKEATKGNILKIRKELEKTNIEDVVILFFAGHGVIAPDMTYYLASTELDTENISETALPYDSFEGMLDGIPARKKIMLLDACHSGEVDEDEGTEGTVADYVNKNSTRSIETQNFMKSADLSKAGSFQLMKNMFADIRKGTGTTIISSAGGKESAIEGAMMKDGKVIKINNGIFTLTMLEGLKTGKADKNNDGSITVSEIRDYIFKHVSKLSAGYQNPTSRRENLEFDFVIWEK